MVYDPVAGQVLLFGGYQAAYGYSNDTWSYDLATNTWTNRTPAVAPPVRSNAMTAFDPLLGEAVLFGGLDSSKYFNDTWSYDPVANTWTNATTAAAPAPRIDAGFAYDSAADRFVLFGGGSSGYLNDTWTYDAAAGAWTRLHPVTAPSPRQGPGMAYDPATDRFVLFGGQTASGAVGDTWSLDLAADTWTNVTPASSPTRRGWAQMAYDPASGHVLLVGGANAASEVVDAWSYDPAANAWTALAAPHVPAPRFGFGMALDAAADRVVLFGGQLATGGYVGDTWSFNAATARWTNLDPGLRPPPREFDGMAYDSGLGEIVVFGGDAASGGPGLADTWTYDYGTNAWTNMTPAASPPPRTAPSLGYDPVLDRVLLFGGGDASFATKRNDAWTYDARANVWTNTTPAQSPPVRAGAGLVYDASVDRFILFGGLGGEYRNDTWAYDPASNLWTNVTPAVSPAPRGFAGFAYDSAAHRTVLFGGFDSFSYFNDTWVFDASARTWTNVTRTVAPDPRFSPGMAYDAAADRFILSGGTNGNGVVLDTWSFDLASDTWTDVVTFHVLVSPPGRQGQSLVYDAAAGRSILFDGYFLGLFNDTWAYEAGARTWTNVSRSSTPPGRYEAMMAYDAAADRTILFGGLDAQGHYLGDTWAYDLGARTWSNLSTGIGPAPRSLAAFAYDSSSDRVILFGGYIPASPFVAQDTWSFDLRSNTWTVLSPSSPPAARAGAGLVDASAAHRLILFGGQGIADYNETWTYDAATDTWANVTAGAAPPPRSGLSLAYDPVADRAVLFGGHVPGTTSDDDHTWSFELGTRTWTDRGTAGAPPARDSAALVDDASAGRILLFGGRTFADVALGDTWAYAVATGVWTRLPTAVSPSVRDEVAMAYDAAANRTVLFSGYWNTNYYADTWTYGYAETPSAPTGLVAAAGNAVVALTWSAPASTGGAAIGAYRIYRGTLAGGERLRATIGPATAYTDLGVTNGVTYYYRVSAVTAAGEGPGSPEASATPGPNADTVPPTIVIASPGPGATLTSANVTVTGTAADNVGVAKVELSLDGTTWTPATGTTAWSGSLTLAAGSNTIRARATDGSGNVGTASVTVTLSSPGSPGSPGGPAAGLPGWLLPAVLVAVGAVLVLILLLVLRRRKPKGPPPEGPKPQGQAPKDAPEERRALEEEL